MPRAKALSVCMLWIINLNLLSPTLAHFRSHCEATDMRILRYYSTILHLSNLIVATTNVYTINVLRTKYTGITG